MFCGYFAHSSTPLGFTEPGERLGSCWALDAPGKFWSQFVRADLSTNQSGDHPDGTPLSHGLALLSAAGARPHLLNEAVGHAGNVIRYGARETLGGDQLAMILGQERRVGHQERE